MVFDDGNEIEKLAREHDALQLTLFLVLFCSAIISVLLKDWYSISPRVCLKIEGLVIFASPCSLALRCIRLVTPFLTPCLSPPKCPSLFNPAIHSVLIVRLSFPLYSPSLSFFTLTFFKGPLTQNVKRSLNITNPNADPVSFKIKTTAPKVILIYRVDPVQLSSSSLVVLRTAQFRKGGPWPDC
jgi:MSP (Major sperm protein) domain